jgi:hypothetical protein
MQHEAKALDHRSFDFPISPGLQLDLCSYQPRPPPARAFHSRPSASRANPGPAAPTCRALAGARECRSPDSWLGASLCLGAKESVTMYRSTLIVICLALTGCASAVQALPPAPTPDLARLAANAVAKAVAELPTQTSYPTYTPHPTASGTSANLAVAAGPTGTSTPISGQHFRHCRRDVHAPK